MKKVQIFYIARCLECSGKGKVDIQLMWNNLIYNGKGTCQKCKGKGMLLMRREERDIKNLPTET